MFMLNVDKIICLATGHAQLRKVFRRAESSPLINYRQKKEGKISPSPN